MKTKRFSHWTSPRTGVFLSAPSGRSDHPAARPLSALKKTPFLGGLGLLLAMLMGGSAFGQIRTPDRPPAEDNSVDAELASFKIHDDFEVSLFADESLGIANPIAMQWDHRGRLWVLTTLAYAQLKPGEIPDDKLLVLEDTDGDGRADKSTVFVDGLDMPTGFALGNGGAYLADGPDLIHLRDTDGDDKFDERQLLLTGFGTGDTHQNISNFVFDSGGFLYFSQGLHAFSHVETPWGVSRGDRAGFWRFDPRTMRLDPFCFSGMTSANPCGIAVDRWGALFIKSNGPRLCFATPGLIPTTHDRELMQYAEVGATAGKSMGVDIVETTAQPDWLQNNALIAGYFARQVSAIPLVEEGSGFKKSEPVVLLSSDHPSFRPVDIRMGPDGGIYVADWFNPVINHYQVSLRHPHRDYDHGRVWRVTAKNHKPVKAPEFDEQSVENWFEALRSLERWTRDQARRLLSDQDPEKVGGVLQKWTQQLDPKSKTDSHTLVEAAGVLESFAMITPAVLDRLQASVEPQTRALAGRIIARAAPPIEGAESRMMQLLSDPHPRPRLEAVIACASYSQPSALIAVLTVLDSEMDKSIDYALGQTLHARAEDWLPVIELDRVKFFTDHHLAFVLDTYGGEIAATAARRTLAKDSLAAEDRPAFLDILARHGTAEDLRNLVVDEAQAHPEVLDTLITAWPGRRIKPAAPYAKKLGEFLSVETASVKIAALRLAGLWRIAELADDIEALALDKKTAPAIRSVALSSFGSLRGNEAAEKLATVAVEKTTPSAVRSSAVEALAMADIAVASDAVLQLVENSADADDLSPILRPVLSKTTGPQALAKSLDGVELAPAKAKKIAGALAGLGRTDGELTAVLNRILGIKDDAPGGAPEDYDAERVAKIVAAVTADKGDAKRGREAYQLTQLNCVACHQINKIGGVIGPSLDAVGAGLPLDQIVDSVLYPARQLKEGYFATAVTTIDGQVHTGYVDPDIVNAANIWLRDAATQKLRPVSTHQLKEMKEIGTLMPPGLTASLNEQQLNDLIAYLASLKG